MDTTTVTAPERHGDHWLRCLCGTPARSGDPHGLCGRCRADQDVRDALDAGGVWAWLRACALSLPVATGLHCGIAGEMLPGETPADSPCP